MPPVSPARISLPDRYRVVRHLASGGMAAVWEAHDELLDRDVAVKILAPHLGEDERARRRFQREARAAAGLSSHPHVVTIYDVGEYAGRVFMVMEIMRGGTLGDRLKSGREIPFETVVRWMREAGEALDAADDAGVVHRDIKPGNIMVLEGPRAKIMDFGIARVRASDVKTQTGVMLGSPKYMSPEQVLGQPADHRSDIFSLGVVLYEMLAGAPPFAGADIPQLMYQVCNARPTPPSHLNPAVPEVLDLVVARALEKALEARYQDAGQLAADLRAWAALAPREAPPAASAPQSPALDEATAAATRVQATLTMAAPVAVGLLPWRRFDSARALERLLHPQGGDRALLAPVASGGARGFAIATDRAVLLGAGVIAAALAIAAAIALA
jgi:serine/threonine-protein kinase